MFNRCLVFPAVFVLVMLGTGCGGKGKGGHATGPTEPDGGKGGDKGPVDTACFPLASTGTQLASDPEFIKKIDTLLFESETTEAQKLTAAIAGNGWNCQ